MATPRGRVAIAERDESDMAAYALTFVFPAAFAMLPGVMDTPAARAMLLAIGLQESRFKYRAQIGGPARGFWQFEQLGGVKGVLEHPQTTIHLLHVCDELRYQPKVPVCYAAIEHNDVLACCFARLLLWTLPGLLAGRSEVDRGWRQYLTGWKPGKPHPDTWHGCFDRAWRLVQP